MGVVKSLYVFTYFIGILIHLNYLNMSLAGANCESTLSIALTLFFFFLNVAFEMK